MGPRVDLKQEPVSPSSDSSAVERWDHRSPCGIDRLRRSIRFHRICGVVYEFFIVKNKGQMQKAVAQR